MSDAKNNRVAMGTWWFALVAIAVAVIGIVFSRPRVPEYQGRSAKQWLGDVFGLSRVGNTKSDDIAGAIAAFRAMDTNGVSFLVQALDQREHPLNEIYRCVSRQLPSVARDWLPLPVSVEELASAAGIVLLKIRDGTPSRTFPRLVHLLNAESPHTRQLAADLVQHYTTNYRNLNLSQFQFELVRALRDTNDWIRIDVAYALMSARLNVPELVPALKSALTNSSSSIRDAARQAIEATVTVFNPTNHHAP
ncbi:MAG: hypothetical protein HY043_07015 [Verrucomicrobia bacterium]|nr:hypothetical protein [Verrucomicrobiota bacterium]